MKVFLNFRITVSLNVTTDDEGIGHPDFGLFVEY